MRNRILLSILIAWTIGCTKDKSPAPFPIAVNIDLLDKYNHSNSEFSYGDDIIFEYSEQNLSNDDVTYYRNSNCVTMHFKIYQNNTLVGDPVPDNSVCTLELRSFTFGQNEINRGTINWYTDSTNMALPIGSYTAKLSISLAIDKPKDWKEFELEKKFEIK